MNHSEFCKLVNNEVNYGDKVWICDYRHNNILEQPIRHVEPQEVFIVCNTELPKNKSVYYSNFHFRPVGKQGQPLARIIAPYDNTGYRAYAGVSLNIFLTKEECVEHYINQCEKIKDDIEVETKRVAQKFMFMLDEVDSKIKKFSNY